MMMTMMMFLCFAFYFDVFSDVDAFAVERFFFGFFFIVARSNYYQLFSIAESNY